MKKVCEVSQSIRNIHVEAISLLGNVKLVSWGRGGMMMLSFLTDSWNLGELAQNLSIIAQSYSFFNNILSFYFSVHI